MCNKITKISEHNKYQWIGVCAHGIAHIHWKTVQIGITKRTLNTLIKQAQTSSLPVEKFSKGYVLWLEHAALKLSEQDYHDFISLLAYADTDHPQPPASVNNTKPQSMHPVIH